MSIAAIEDAIIERLKLRFRGRLRVIDHRPVKLDAEELQRVLTQAPGAYVAFLGFSQLARPEGCVAASFGVYLIAENAAGEPARRRGDAASIGSYDMTMIAARALHRFAPAAAAGAMEVRSCDPLASPAFDKLGRSVNGLVVAVPMEISASSGWSGGAPTDPEDDPEAELRDFALLTVDWDIPPHGVGATGQPADIAPLPAAAPDAADRLVLPQS
jgi:phage gp37-like protein